jgi:two-component system phosphate regulon response regulator PhoB/two-component system alkaline phosphatase synthesis response regulator PhoP
MNELVAVVDDEPDILELVSIHLKKERFRVREFGDAESFYRFLRSDVPTLIVLDLMLPDANGFEICKYIRKTSRLAAVPIIILTARADEGDRVLGLELGADDYVLKPFSPKELVARIKAVLRRMEPVKVPAEAIEVDKLLTLYPGKHEVTVKGEKIDLTSTEFRLLEILASKKGWVFSRDKILDHLWGSEKMVLDRTVDVHIKHLREKLGQAGKLIKNIRGVGYKLQE